MYISSNEVSIKYFSLNTIHEYIVVSNYNYHVFISVHYLFFFFFSTLIFIYSSLLVVWTGQSCSHTYLDCQVEWVQCIDQQPFALNHPELRQTKIL